MAATSARFLAPLLVALGSGLGCLAENPAPEAAPRLAQLAWMSGSWAGESQGTSMEELWLEPRGGMMLGLHRDIFSSGKAFFEYLRIEEQPEGVFMLPSPRGAEPTAFRLVETGDRRAVFTNPDHDWPKRLTYWIDEGGQLCARAAGGESQRVAQWCWARVDRRAS